MLTFGKIRNYLKKTSKTTNPLTQVKQILRNSFMIVHTLAYGTDYEFFQRILT